MEIEVPPAPVHAKSKGHVVYVTGRSGDRAAFIHASFPGLQLVHGAEFPESFVPGQLYNLKWSCRNASAVLAELTGPLKKTKKTYESRRQCVFFTAHYEPIILRSLLLGCRILDFRNTRATVISMEPLVISVPPQRDRDSPHPATLHFLSDAGEECSVVVMSTQQERDRDLLLCTPISGFPKNSAFLEIHNEEGKPLTPAVTRVLEAAYLKIIPISIESLDMADRIYGPPKSYRISEDSVEMVYMECGDRTIKFDHQQSMALYRYAAAFGPPEIAPAFIVEGGPGTGKTFLAAAMAVSYCKAGVGGLQLLLCPSEYTLRVLERTLESLTTGHIKILSLDESSSLSVMNGDDKENNPSLALYAHLEMQLVRATSALEERAIRKRLESARAASLAACGQKNIILATPDQILEILMDAAPSRLKSQLQLDVTRVVIDHAEQVTEATLNALILSFPHAMLAVLGDCQQLLPSSYTPHDLPSELAAADALSLLKMRKNLPIIKLSGMHRTMQSKARHYVDVFNEVPSGKSNPEDDDCFGHDIVLSAVYDRVTQDLAYVKLLPTKLEISEGIHKVEIAAMRRAVDRLQAAGYYHRSVMIVAFSESQCELAKTSLSIEYEVLTVEQAQGREASIVILLTTSCASESDASLQCPRRVNIAVSRHRDALLIFGTEGLSLMNPWDRILDRYFDHVWFSSK